MNDLSPAEETPTSNPTEMMGLDVVDSNRHQEAVDRTLDLANARDTTDSPSALPDVVDRAQLDLTMVKNTTDRSDCHLDAGRSSLVSDVVDRVPDQTEPEEKTDSQSVMSNVVPHVPEPLQELKPILKVVGAGRKLRPKTLTIFSTGLFSMDEVAANEPTTLCSEPE